MKTIIMSLSVFSLVSCGPTSKFVPAQASVPELVKSMPDLPDDEEVKLIASEFYADAQSISHPLNRSVKDIIFVDGFDDDTTHSIVGRCYFYSDQNGRPTYREVNILRSAWATGSSQFKKTLLFHELGHCALSLEHVAPNSGAIMEPSVIPDDYAANNWLQLVHDEFKASTVSLALADTIDDIMHVTVK